MEPRQTKRTHPPQRVSIGVERLLYRAATDSTFRNVLLCDRAEAVRIEDIELTSAEQRMLDAIPDATLASMVDAVRPANPKRRRFMTAVAAASAAAAGVMQINCDHMVATGSRPPDDGDVEQDAEVTEDAEVSEDASPQ